MGPASQEGLATLFSIMGQVSAVDFQTLLAASTLASAAEPLIAPAVPIAASAVGRVIPLVSTVSAPAALPPASAGARATSLAEIPAASPAGGGTPPSHSQPPPPART